MSFGTLMGLATVFAMVAFVGVCLWAWSDKRRQAFDEAANLPFADEPDDNATKQGHSE